MSRAGRGAVARRRAVAACAAAAVTAAGAALALPQLGAGESSGPPVVAEPYLSPMDAQATLLGAVSRGPEAGATWAYRRLPLTAGAPAVGGRRLELGAASDAKDRQLAFLRYSAASGWQVFQTPVDESGTPYRGMQPNVLSGRMTPSGGGVLVGRDPRRPDGKQLVVLDRDPGGRFQALAAPPAGDPPDGVLRPAGGGEPAEALAGDDGAGRVVDATFDEGGRTGLLFAPIGRAAQDGVVHFDGNGWGREPIEIPDRQAGDSFQILALSAAGPRDAWMLAQTDPRLGRGISLFRRVIENESARWVDEGDLGGSQFATRPDIEALGGAADPLTATTSGVWVDGRLGSGSSDPTFTFFYDGAAKKVTGSWCDDPVCDHRLGVALSEQDGYRSFAWAGPGFGTRIITNPLDPNGAPSTNRGTYLRLDGSAFSRMPGAGGNGRRGGAFASDDDGWLDGPVHVTRSPEGATPLTQWPLTLRAPLTGVAAQPDAPPGDSNASALAVGGDGGVTRYTPGKGWVREFLLTSTGAVSRPVLRGVAWPEPGRAYAVGDAGAMWLWRSETGLWEKDAGAPIGFEGNLMGVAFQPGDPLRGYAVGRAGTLLKYGKSWTQEQVPDGFGSADFTSVAFAGSEALVAAGGDILANSGSGWHVDEDAHRLLASAAGDSPRIFTVAGLPDGGAVAAGRDLVIERDGPGKPWRYADQPLPGSTVVAAAATRAGADPSQVRAVVSVVPRVDYPIDEPLPPPDPNTPAPIQPAFPLPPDGYLLRETASGWRDEQHSSFGGSGADRPVKTDPVLAFDLSSGGQGWAVGGWSGEADSAGRGSSGRNAQGRADRARVETAAAFRYGEADGGPAPTGGGRTEVPLAGGVVRFAVGGHAECAGPCADLSGQQIGPDRTLRATLGAVQSLAGQPGGPRFFLYTGGRLPPGTNAAPAAEEQRFADLLGGTSTPVFPAASSGDTAGGTSATFRAAFASFGAPFGNGPAADGITPDGTTPAGGGAHTHYAFDSAGGDGTIRVIVIDNSAGSLADSDPLQNPSEPQLPWLEAQLAAAKSRGIPSVVMGSRDLASGFQPSLNAATDGDQVAKALVAGGASAYFYERPEENRQLRIPSGAPDTIPEFGTGTLGYRSPITGSTRSGQADSLFGDTGFLLAEVDASKRDAQTNRAPVAVRLVPTVDDVSLQAVDGTLLRRSRPALFQGLGRRPTGGDRWGDVSPTDGNADPPGGDPYTAFPPDLCQVAGCSTRIAPEYSFSSSDDDIGDFVRQDPASTNARKPFLDADGKTVTDASSGLFCAFNAGTTKVTVTAGGLSYSTAVTVQPGSVQRPCGTRPLKPSRFTATAPAVPAPPPPAPAPAPASNPPVKLTPPAPPAPAPTPAVVPPAKVPPVKPRPAQPRPPALPRLAVSAPPLVKSAGPGRTPSSPPPQPPTAVRPIPPGGAVARVYQVEEKKEEELATEESSAFSRYHAEEHESPEKYLIGLAVIAALAGAGIRLGGRGRGATVAPAEARNRISENDYRRRRR